jgi:hypothetical protein
VKVPLEQPAPCQRISTRTWQPGAAGVTTQVVTMEERSSVSVSTRPGSGSATYIRKVRAPPADGHLEAVQRAGTHATLLDPKRRERGRRQCR